MGLAVADLHRLVLRALAGDLLHPVGLVQRHEGQPVPHVPLVLRVDIAKLIRLHQIVGADHAAVGNQLLSPALRFAQIGRLSVAVLERSDLDVIERQVVPPPQSAPQRDHIEQPRGVIHVAAGVRFALIPEESADGIARHRTKHSIIHDHRTQVLRDAGDSLFGQVDVRITAQHFAAHPAFDAASAPRAVDDADRNAEHVIEHFGEEVTRSGEFRRSSGHAGRPASGRPVLRHIGCGMRNLHIMEFSAFGARAGDDLASVTGHCQKPPSGISILLCPPANHTSPISTRSNVTRSPLAKVIRCGS